jgi:hypothetical protein
MRPRHNPYRGQEERLRWEKGFLDALESPDQKITVPGASLRGRASKKNAPQ